VTLFGEAYARAYDWLYADKDYGAECAMLEEVFRRYADGPVRAILDLGCGTGSHAVILARAGRKVVGVDRSPAMLAQARAKSSAVSRWVEGDLRTVDAGGPFDVVLLMFAVLSYQLTNEDVLAALANARRHLAPRGLLVFDAWCGAGVLTDPPGETVKTIETPEGAVARHAKGELDVRNSLCRVAYTLVPAGRGTPQEQASEVHVVRYFFPTEVDLLLLASGFEPIQQSPFESLDKEISRNSWNLLVVARAI
jgi:SAM-dependent methyltransferase